MSGVFNWFIKNWANFKGRARRKEYWLYTLVMIVFSIVMSIIFKSHPTAYRLSTFVYFIVFMIPGIAVSMRRLHDIGKSGWNFLLTLIPLVGPIILLVFYCRKSQEGENRYGPQPLA